MTYKPDSNVTWLVIHYSATPIERDFTSDDIDQMHRVRGFKEIGYHFYIRKDGTVEKGRDLSESGRFEVGAHSKGENSRSIGICYEGGVSESAPNVGYDTRTREQLVAMEALILSLLDRFPSAIVEGHRDMPGAATQCPGFNTREWWGEVSKRRASEILLPSAVADVVADAGKTPSKATTNWASFFGIISGGFAAFKTADPLVQAAGLIVVAVLVYVMRERLRKAKLGDAAKQALGM